ncbi:MAG: LLM class flavin-dependent oxidoreductase [Dehalococcoidia bacterium]
MRLSIGTTLWRTQADGERAPKTILEGWDREIDHLMWQARMADVGGFENIWLTEHHFSHHSSASSPSVVLAYMASITQRVGLAYGIALLPMRNPILMAEEMLWVDQLSKGRLSVGVGRGHTAIEFAAFGVTAETERDSFVEALSIVSTALRGEPVEFSGKVWKTPFLYLTPGPFQKDGPPIHLVTTSEWSMRQAVAFRAAPILGIDAPAEIKQQLDAFRSFCTEGGLPEQTIDDLVSRAKCTRRISVSDSRAEAEEEIYRGMAEADEAWFRFSKPVDDRSFFDPWVPATADNFRDGFKSSTPGKDLAHVIHGTPDDVVEQIRALEVQTGLKHISSSVSSHGIRRSLAEKQMTLLIEEVIPRI